MEIVKNREQQEVVNTENVKTNTISRKDKIKKTILDILKNNLIFIIGSILLIYKGLLLNYLIDLTIEKDVIIYNILASLLIMSPTINHKDKFGYIYLNVVYGIVTFLIYADFLYYTYATNFLSFYQIGNLIYSKEIASGVTTIINIKSILIFCVDNVLLAVLSILAYKKFEKTYYSNKILKIILILIILLLNIFTITNTINGIYKEKGYNKSLIVQDASIYYYHYEDAKDYFRSLLGQEEIDEKRFQNAYNKYINVESSVTDYTGIAQDSNVIILQLESLNEYVIGKTVNGKEIMPNLNKFFNDNIYYCDMYNQGLGSTADSEFEMENSMYPLENGYIFQKYFDNEWLDIYTVLKDAGYYTSFMHPNTSTFWNREEVYNTGYKIDEYNDIRSFPNIEQAGGFYSDEGFFEEAVKIMNSYEGKFCTTLVSVTTHIPFYLDGVSDLDNKLTLTQEDVSEFEDETFRNYLISCNFVDYAFGKFLRELEETGLLDNSILIVYGDHGASISSTEDIAKLYTNNGVDYSDFEDSFKEVHVPFGIKIPGVENNDTIKRSVAKIDIKPTILDLLGVEDKFSIGITLFSNKDYSFIKGLGFVTSSSYCINGRYFDRETLEEIIENKELKQLLEQMEEEIYLSDTIIRNDLIRILNYDKI